MLSENTVTKLQEIRLGVMAQHFRQQLLNPAMNELAFEERFGLLVDAEWSVRKSNRLKRLIKDACYAIPGACVEDIAYHAERKLDKGSIARLSGCTYIHENRNVIILGATGAGKTYLAWALLQAAISFRLSMLGSLIFSVILQLPEGMVHTVIFLKNIHRRDS